MKKTYRLLSYFPRLHIFLLVTITLVFLVLFFFTDSKHKNLESLERSLITEVSLESLEEVNLIQEKNDSAINKESIIRRNDTLYSILEIWELRLIILLV